MPIGSKHIESGLLVRDGQSLYLRRDEGGHWRLEAPAKATKMIGQRVSIEGERDGFDLLFVKRISLTR